MAWVFLAIAGVCEVGWAIALKEADGFTRLGPSLVFLASAAASLLFLLLALKSLPVGTAYAVWTGIGAVGTALLGVALLGEGASPLRLVSVGVVVLGIVGLYLAEA